MAARCAYFLEYQVFTLKPLVHLHQRLSHKWLMFNAVGEAGKETWKEAGKVTGMKLDLTRFAGGARPENAIIFIIFVKKQ